MRSILLLILGLFLHSLPLSAAPLGEEATIEEILDALDARGRTLDTLVADVTKTETDLSLGEDGESRSGRVVYQRKSDGDVRIRASFDQVRTGEKTREERVEYVLDNGRLIDRSYRSKVEVQRIVQRPGEKLDLFKLGQGPFPLPIGQARQDVLAEFEVSRQPADAGDPPGTLRVRLSPLPGTHLSRKFLTIDVWVDRTDHMPRRIDTVNVQQSVLTSTELANVKVNAPLTDKEFALERINEREWKITEEAMD